MIKLLLIFILTSIAPAIAQCPCDSFVNDVKKLPTFSENAELTNEIRRIRDCISCREKLGLNYHFCGQGIDGNVERIKKLELSSAEKADSGIVDKNLLFYKLNEYKEDCQENRCIDIDKHTDGRVLIGSGIGFLTGAAIMIGLSPLMLKWAYSVEGLTGWLFPDVIVILGKVIAGVIVPVADIGLCAGGIATIRIGMTKKREFEQLQKELPKFKRDVEYLPCVQVDF